MLTFLTSIANALGSAASIFTSTLAQIGNGIRIALLPFTLALKLLSGIFNILMGVVNFVVTGFNLLLGGLKLVGSVLTAIAKVGMGAVSFVASLPGTILSALHGVLGAIGGIAGVLIEALGKVAGLVGGVFVGAIAASAIALKTAAQSALEFARNAAQLSATTGLGFAGAAGVQRRFGAQGISGADVNGALGGQNAAIFRMKAGAFGLPGFDAPDFIPRLAREFQRLNSQGMPGQMQAQNLLKVLGLNSPQFAALANMDPRKIQQNQSFSSGVQRSLGLNDASANRYANDIPQVINRIGIVFESLKEKLATSFLPVIESVLNGVANFGAANAGAIGKFIDELARKAFVELPILAGNAMVWLAEGAAKGVGKTIEIAQLLATGLPRWMGGAVDFVANALLYLVAKLQDFGPKFIEAIAKALIGVTHTIAGWMRSLADGLDQFSTGQGPFFDVLNFTAQAVDVLVDLIRQTAGVFAFLGADIQTFLAMSPAGQLFSKWAGLGWIAPSDPVKAYNDTVNLIPQSSLALGLSQLTNPVSMGKSTKSLRGSADTLEQWGIDAAAQWKTTATTALNGALGALSGAANWLAPKDANGQPMPNKGEVAGNYAAGHLNAVTDALKSIQPMIDNMAAATLEYRKSLGTEEQRNARWQEMMLAESKQQTALLKQQVQSTGSGGASFDRTYAYVAEKWAKDQGKSLRTL